MQLRFPTPLPSTYYGTDVGDSRSSGAEAEVTRIVERMSDVLSC
jgi:hypothetical protein